MEFSSFHLFSTGPIPQSRFLTMEAPHLPAGLRHPWIKRVRDWEERFHPARKHSLLVKTQPFEFKVLSVRECVAPGDLVDTPQRAFEYWNTNIPSATWFDPMKEAFVVLVVNTKRRIIGHNLVAIGCLDSVTVRPLEVFRPIIVAAGSAAILMHNHPSMDPTPSSGDIRVTRELIRASELLRIEILDHVIVGSTFASLRALGYIGS